MRARKIIRAVLIVLGAVALLLVAMWIALYLTVGPSQACRNPSTGPAGPGRSFRTVISGGDERCYLLVVPETTDLSQPVPLVISLHGFLGNARAQESLSLWNEVADSEGIVIAYPEATLYPLRWNSSPEFNATHVNDIQFMKDLINDIAGIMPVDRSRVYVNGMSNGGAMTALIACEMADQVAAVGIVAAPTVPDADTCRPARPMPVIVFHGTDDSIASYNSSVNLCENLSCQMFRRMLNIELGPVRTPPVEEGINMWVALNGCNPAPETIPQDGDVRGVRYTGCNEDAEVVFYTIEGGGHAWPGGTPLDALGKTSTDISASQTMWEFFSAHPMEHGS
jgi:polyhydroxybutyrate depolymerase